MDRRKRNRAARLRAKRDVRLDAKIEREVAWMFKMAAITARAVDLARHGFPLTHAIRVGFGGGDDAA